MPRRRKMWVLSVSLALLVGGTLHAAPRTSTPKTPQSSKSSKNAKQNAPDPLQALEWRCVGPYRGGRVTAVAGVSGQPLVYYFGATGGGVWKTVDAGARWSNISDGYFATGSVGAIAVAPSDPNVVYVGMGESCIRGNVSH